MSLFEPTRRTFVRFALIFVLAGIFVDAHATVDPTTGEYRIDVVDLSVKVVGGSLNFSREYEANAWRFAPTWSALRLEVDALEGAVARIDRAGDIYEKIDSGGTLYRFDQRLTIRKTESGWRWADRDGNWMEYTTSGQPQRFGNRIGNVVTLNYSGDKLASVVDPMNRAVFTVTWSGNQIASVKDYTDREVRYGYTGNLLTQVTDVRGKVWTYQYTDGKLSALIDPLQRKTAIALSAAGRVRSETDAAGAVTRYAFDYLSGPKQYYLKTIRENGEKQEVTETWTDRERQLVRRDVNGVTMLTVARDGRNRIHTDSRGRRTTYLYDEFRNPTGVIYPDGSKVTSTYDVGTSNLLTTTNERGSITEHQYHSNGLRRRTIEAKGTGVERVKEFAYDPQGRLTTITQVGDAVTQEAMTRYTYDAAGNVVTLTDAEDGVTRFEDYDAQGNAWTRIDAHGKRWTATFDAAGNLLTQTDPLNHTTSHTYDDAGRRSRTTYPPADAGELAATVDFGYDHADRLITTTDALGGIKHTVYDAAGNRIEERDESDKKTNYTYDALNRLSTIVDGNGNTTRHVYPDPVNPGPDAGDLYQPIRIEYPTYAREIKYDLRGRVWSQTNVFQGGGQTRRQTTITRFDSAGNVIETLDPAQRNTKQTYDARGRLTKTTNALSGETTYGYDDRDNLLSLTDAKDNTHRFSYDRLNRIKTESRPLGQSHRYDYDPTGNLTQKLDARNQKSVYSYDDAGRRNTIEYFQANQSATHKTVTFAYNARNTLTGYDDGTTQGRYVHDALQRKTQESVDYGDFTWTYGYSYFPNGQKQSYTAIDGSTFAYGYDAAQQLQSLSIPGEGSIQYGDYRWARPQTIRYPGGTARTLGYDGLLRTETIRVVNTANATLMDYRYVYDDAGNIIGKTTEHGPYRYEYDDLDRLTVADYPNGPNHDQIDESFQPNTFPFADDRYSYDPLGNRTRDHRRTNATPWQYNDNNELLHSGFAAYDYNANGSTVAKKNPQTDTPLQTYVYNTEERMSEVRNEQGQLIAEYYYDPFGRRLWKTLYPGAEGHAGGTTPERHYLAYSDEGYAGEYARSTTEALPPATENLTLYVFAPESPWSTDPILMKRNNQTRYFGTDQLGTSQWLVDAAGARVNWSRATAFGETDESGDAQPLRFPGQIGDGETGTYYNYYRAYDPALGRYLQFDPAGLNGGDPSFYSYARNNSLTHVDELGLKARICCVKIPRWFVPAVHCFVHLESEEDNGRQCCLPKPFKSKTIGLHGFPPGGDSDYANAGQIKINHSFDDVNDSKCGDWNVDCGAIDCVEKAAAAYPDPSTYKLLGPNSNTFAKTMASKCGLKKPDTSWPATGWNANPATPAVNPQRVEGR